MAIPTNVTPYATVAEADALINPNSDAWIGALPDAKLEALQQGRIYIDLYYTCNISDPTDQNVKDANILLAEKHVTQNIFGRQTGKGPLSEETVKAGSVASTKKYAVSSQGSQAWIDPFPEITALLAQDGVCTLSKGGVHTVNLERA